MEKLNDMGTTGLQHWVESALSQREFRLRKGRAAKVIEGKRGARAAQAFRCICRPPIFGCYVVEVD